MREAPFLGKGVLLWGDLLNIISYLSLNEVYRKIGHLCRDGFMMFRREREYRACPLHCRGESRFLSRTHGHEKVLLVSYPRSGNSYLRRLLESSLGIVTGSDSRNNRPLSAALLRCGFKGEGIVDNSCWIVKSHFPERCGFLRFRAQRVILLVRNPFDAIESYFHMAFTNTHDKHLTQSSLESLKDIWKDFLPCEGKIWRHFHEYWISKAAQLPILLVRYEDLLRKKDETLQTILQFLGTGQTPNGKSCLKRVGSGGENGNSSDSNPNQKEGSNGPGYVPKSRGSNVVGKSLRLISDEDIDTFVETHRQLLDYFGYNLLLHGNQSTNGHDGSSNDVMSHSYTLDESRKYLGLSCVDLKSSSSAMEMPSDEVCQSLLSKVESLKHIDRTTLFEDAEIGATMQTKSILVNENFCIRPPDDKYGRDVTNLRRSLTKDDTEPLPVNG